MFEIVMPYALWSCLYNDTLLDLLCLTLRCLTFPTSWCLMFFFHHIIFFDLVFVFLFNLLYIKPHCLPVIKLCFAAWSSLYYVRLPDLVFMMPNCWMSCTLDYAVWSVLHDAARSSYLMLGCLMSPKSSYVFYFCFTLLYYLILSSLSYITSPPALPTSCYWYFRH